MYIYGAYLGEYPLFKRICLRFAALCELNPLVSRGRRYKFETPCRANAVAGKGFVLRWPAHTLRIPRNSNSDVLPALLPRLPSAKYRNPIRDDSPGAAPQTLIPSLGCSLRLPSAKCRNPIRDDSPGPHPPDPYSVAGSLPPASFRQMQESYSGMTLSGRHIREAGGASFCIQAVLGAYPPAHTLQGWELWN